MTKKELIEALKDVPDHYTVELVYGECDGHKSWNYAPVARVFPKVWETNAGTDYTVVIEAGTW
jgi:hypothetical protein